MQLGVLHGVGHVICHSTKYQSFESFGWNRSSGSSSWNRFHSLPKAAEEFGSKLKKPACKLQIPSLCGARTSSAFG